MLLSFLGLRLVHQGRGYEPARFLDLNLPARGRFGNDPPGTDQQYITAFRMDVSGAFASLVCSGRYWVMESTVRRIRRDERFAVLLKQMGSPRISVCLRRISTAKV